MTIQEIKTNPEFLCGLELPEMQVYLIYTGGNKVQYYVFRNGVILFEGRDFRPSPMHNQDDIESVISLLGFLTCQPGDTDRDYFATYTPAQMEWAKSSECEQLKCQVGDFENNSEDNQDFHVQACEYFNSRFVTPFAPEIAVK